MARKESNSPLLNEMPRNSNGGFVVPPGRTLADMPKAGAKPIPPSGARPPNVRLTFRNMLTENDTKTYLVDLLKELGTKHKKGSWKKHLEFYIQNQSGDVDAMSDEVKTKCEKIVKELNDHYFSEQDL